MIYSFSIGKKKQTDSVKRQREGNKGVVAYRIRRSCVHSSHSSCGVYCYGTSRGKWWCNQVKMLLYTLVYNGPTWFVSLLATEQCCFVSYKVNWASGFSGLEWWNGMMTSYMVKLSSTPTQWSPMNKDHVYKRSPKF